MRHQGRFRTDHIMTDLLASPTDREMTDRSPSRSRANIYDRVATPSITDIDCPWFIASVDMHFPRPCTNPFLENMSAVRRHATRGRKSHLPFLRQCRTCRKVFRDKHTFESRHGYTGEKCADRAITDNPQTQWKQLYNIACEQLDGLKSERKSCE